jgi:hypothetical protein
MILLAAINTAGGDSTGQFLVIGMVVQFFWSAIVSFAIWKMSKMDRNTEKLEQRLHETTTKLVDERLRGITHEVRGHMNQLVLTIDELKGKLQLGDGEIRDMNKELGERDHTREIQILQRVNEVKSYVIEHAASKQDLKEHQGRMDTKVEKINERLGQQDRTLAVIERVVNENHGTQGRNS